jgi:AraC-like DNA-binding protein
MAQPEAGQFPAGHTTFRTTDVDLATEQVGHLYSPHRLRLMDNAPDFYCEVDSVQLGPVTVSYLAYSSPVVISGPDPETYYAISWPIGGRAEVRQEHDDTLTGPDRAGVLNPEGTVRLRWSEDLELLSARIEREALLAQLARLLGGPVTRPLRFEQPMNLADGAWTDAVERVHDVVSSPVDAVTNPLVTATAEDALLTALLLLQPNSYSARLHALPEPTPPRAVRRTMELVEATPEWPHTPATMAAETGVGVRGLTEAFHRIAEADPAAFLREARLSRAHEQLTAADPGTVTVPEVALRWGFDDPARFAGAYERRYGTAPGQDLPSP